jgi:hypothetical protein
MTIEDTAAARRPWPMEVHRPQKLVRALTFAPIIV